MSKGGLDEKVSFFLTASLAKGHILQIQGDLGSLSFGEGWGEVSTNSSSSPS